jgi:hypothetical protein
MLAEILCRSLAFVLFESEQKNVRACRNQSAVCVKGQAGKNRTNYRRLRRIRRLF